KKRTYGRRTMTTPDNSTPDINDILAQAARVQAELQKAQEEILATKVEGTAGNGLVTVTMTGGAEHVDLKIDKSVVDPEDVETLLDLVFSTCKDAHQKAGQLAQDKSGPQSKSMKDGGMSSMFG